MKKAALLLLLLVALAPQSFGGSREWIDRPVTIQADDLYVRTALRLLAEQAKVNIAFSKSLRGHVALRVNGEPAGRVLARITAQANADACIERNSVYVFPKGTTRCGGKTGPEIELLGR